jgi:PAS domain S-box-containing protein
MRTDRSFSERVNTFGIRLATWRESLEKIRTDPERAMLEMETAAEELRAAEEELRQQNEELLAVQMQLEEEREKYLDLFEMAPDGYLVTDERGVIVEANRAAVQLLGVRREFLAGKTLLRFLHADDVRTARHQLTLSQQTRGAAEWTARIAPRASASFTAGITVTPIMKRSDQGGSGGPVCAGFRWLVRDVSDRIRAEMNARGLAAEVEELRALHSSAMQMERSELSDERVARKTAEAEARAKDSFLALVAHELRNGLTPMMLAIDELLAAKKLDPEECREKLEMMQRNLAAERRLIDDLRDVTRVMHGKMVAGERPWESRGT